MLSAAALRGFVGRRRRKPKGSVTVLAAVFMIAAMALLSLALDAGYLAAVRCELKRSADAAALAGAGVLVDGHEAAELEAFRFYAQNTIGGRSLTRDAGWQDGTRPLCGCHRARARGRMERARSDWRRRPSCRR